MLQIAIVDDRLEDAEWLQSQVLHYLKQGKRPYRIQIFQDSVAFIQSPERFHMAFLDIRMEKIDGLETAHFLRKINQDTVIVFVTQMAQLAIRGYEVDALDFVIKPSEQAAIDRVMERALARVAKQRDEHLVLKTSKGVYHLPLKRITYIEIYNHELSYHSLDGSYQVRGQLNAVYEQLKDKDFVLCSRSSLVNLRHVQSIHRDHVICGGERVHLSKSRYQELKQALVRYLGESL